MLACIVLNAQSGVSVRTNNRKAIGGCLKDARGVSISGINNGENYGDASVFKRVVGIVGVLRITIPDVF